MTLPPDYHDDGGHFRVSPNYRPPGRIRLAWRGWEAAIGGALPAVIVPVGLLIIGLQMAYIWLAGI